MRPIVSTIDTAGYVISKFIKNVLKEIFPRTELSLLNSSQLKEKLDKAKCQNDEVLVSFDIVAMYTNIPIDLAIEIIQSKITDEMNW